MMVMENPSPLSSEIPKWWREKVVISSSARDFAAGSPSSPFVPMPPLEISDLILLQIYLDL